LSYNWQDMLGNTVSTNLDLTNVSAGIYTIIIENSSNCSVSKQYTINNVGAPNPPSATSPSPYCEGDNILPLEANGSGGTLTWYSDASLTNVLGNGNQLELNPSPTVTRKYYVTEDGTCESAPTIVTVTINPLPEVDLGADQFLCEGETATLNPGYFNSYLWSTGSTNQNITISTTDEYWIEVVNYNGCSNKDTAHVSFNSIYNLDLAASICNGDFYVFGLQTLSETGTYTEVFNTVNGCDSIVELSLTVHPSFNFNESHTICDGQTYSWQGSDYTATGTYFKEFTSENGCDSIYILNLTVNPAYAYIEDHEICEGETYLWRGSDYTATGTYNENYTSVDGCDSTYTLNLTVNPVYAYTEDQEICEGESYFAGGDYQTRTGTYTDSLTTINGCDSIIVTNLTVNPIFESKIDISICEGETYSWQGNDYDTTGTYIVNLTSLSGCDSIRELSLMVYENPIAGFTFDINDREVTFTNTSENVSSYFWDFGNSITETAENPVYTYASPGEYSVILTAYSDYCGEAIDTQSVSITTGIGVIEFENLVKIYPNPTTGIVNYEIDGFRSKEIKIEILQEEGKLVMQKLFKNANKPIVGEVNLSNKPKGIYLFKVYDGNELMTVARIVIQ